MNSDWDRVKSLGLLPGIRSESDYRKAVAEGLNSARDFLTSLPYSVPTLRDIQMAHAVTFYRVHPWAGNFREAGYEVDVGQIQCTEAVDVPKQLKSLAAEVKTVLAGADTPTKQVLWFAQYHSAFEMIHPFKDGNGRIGRLILGSQLDRVLNDKKRSLLLRDEYTAALERAQLGGDISRLFELVMESRVPVRKMERMREKNRELMLQL